EPVPRAVGVASGERLVNGAHAASGPFGLGPRPERARLDELPGPPQPGPAIDRLRDARGVLQRAAYYPRMQRLQVQGAQGRHPHDPAVHDPPGHRTGAEQAVVVPGRIIWTCTRVWSKRHSQSRLATGTGTTLKRR